MILASFTIPIRAPSTANLREHWGARHRRNSKQKSDTRLLCPRWSSGPLFLVTLTRVGPRELDSDNLAAALKGCRDAIASWLRIDDGSPLVVWQYENEPGEPAVRVSVEQWRSREGGT